MKKPTRPKIKVTGVTNLKEPLEKMAVISHSIYGGSDDLCPVVSIENAINLLTQIKKQNPNTVLIMSKKSMYLGILNHNDYEERLKLYEEELKEYKERRKAILLKQLEELDA